MEDGRSFIDAESSANLREQATFVVERCTDGGFWVVLEEVSPCPLLPTSRLIEIRLRWCLFLDVHHIRNMCH